MSIQLQGNDESTFANDVTIASGQASINAGGEYFTKDRSGYFIKTTGDYGGGIFSTLNTLASDRPYIAINAGGIPAIACDEISQDVRFCGAAANGGSLNTPVAQIFGDGSATFAKNVVVNCPGGVDGFTSKGSNMSAQSCYYSEISNTPESNASHFFAVTDTRKVWSITKDGTTSTRNVLLDLDTGGTLDVKDRLQNTRAILLRLKAALIQPDADVNTLRARLLEAFDILTLEGDEE